MKTLLRRCIALGIFFSLSLVAGGTILLSERLLVRVEGTYGTDARQRLEQWQEMMVKKSGEPELTKVNLVNRFFNRVPYRSDLANWGRPDYWATPVEMLSVNGGDCEDYAIAKYFSLTEMGVPSERLQITYVTAVDGSQAHIVLVYSTAAEAEPLVLDNLTDNVMPASQRRDLVPLYSFNVEGLWLSKERGRGQLVGKSDRISLWNDLLTRMDREAAAAETIARTPDTIMVSIKPAASGLEVR